MKRLIFLQMVSECVPLLQVGDLRVHQHLINLKLMPPLHWATMVICAEDLALWRQKKTVSATVSQCSTVYRSVNCTRPLWPVHLYLSTAHYHSPRSGSYSAAVLRTPMQCNALPLKISYKFHRQPLCHFGVIFQRSNISASFPDHIWNYLLI